MHVFVTSQSHHRNLLLCKEFEVFPSLTVVLKHQIYLTNVLVLEALTCAVLHLYTPLATDAFSLCTTFRHPLTSSPPQVAVLQTYQLLSSLCASKQHFWLSALITNTTFLTNHATVLRHLIWKKFCPADVLNSQARNAREKITPFCSCSLQNQYLFYALGWFVLFFSPPDKLKS